MTIVDTTGYCQVGGTKAGSYYLVEPDILLAVPHESYRQTVGDARRSLAEANRIARERRRSHVTIVLVDRVSSQDAGSRRVWTREADPELMCGLALVCTSRLARAIGSFFIGLTKPKVPTEMFGSWEEALDWSRETACQRATALADNEQTSP